MVSVAVRDILNVDTISRVTSAWRSLIDIADKTDGNILFDFRGIHLVEPWTNEDFKQLMKNENVHLKIYTAVDIRDTVELMLAIGNLKTGRVENEDIMTDPTLSTVEKAIDRERIQLKEGFKDDNGIMTILLGGLRSYMSESSTIIGLQQAIEELHAEGEHSSFRLNLDSVTATDTMLMKLAETIGDIEAKGITLAVDAIDDALIDKLVTFQCIGSDKLTNKERFDIFRSLIKPGTVGMLTKYQTTTKLDVYGRMGDGIPLICRPAIFDGFTKVDGIIKARFTTYILSTFYTRQDFSLDNDGARLRKLNTEIVYVTLNDIGICNKFTGKEYHFNLPIQLNPDDCHSTYKIDGFGTGVAKLILPEYIKKVLDDHSVSYDMAGLLDAITENKKLLREKFNFEV